MNLDFDACYRAIRSRDSRFDGHFFTGVTSTGIYCRPVCPAQTPRVDHVRFYVCAAAAEASGFRACRRCRPDVAPGSPDWNVRADLVARALRLIAEGAMDADGVRGLAQRLAVSERHLHREMVAEVGAGPLALGRTRRAQTARLLVDQTDMSISAISYAAGFKSIRQFNETMQAAFGCSPTELRRNKNRPAAGGGDLVLHLGFRPPFAAAELLEYFRARAIPGVEEVTSERYRRTVQLPQSTGIVDLEPLTRTNQVLLRLRLDDLADLGLLTERCRQLLDLGADPDAVNDVLGADPLLAPLVAQRPGLRVPGTVDGFELAVRAILGQQITVSGARTLLGRLVSRLGTPLEEPEGSLTHLFPSPESVAEANLENLGLTHARSAALHSLARSVTRGDLTLDRGADRQKTEATLLALPGVGPWTASYIAMRALGDPDAIPETDLGLRRAFEQHGLRVGRGGIAGRADAWRPWRAYAAHHLWATLAARTTILKERGMDS